MTSGPIKHVSDTARWVAIYRAMETERPDAIFRDPYARTLAGASGEEIVNGLRRGKQFAWPMIVRTAVMDEIILRYVQDHNVDTVLNLACGLDARAYRLSLPRDLRWIDADLPDIIAYRTEQLSGHEPVCDAKAIPVDLSDADARRALFDRVPGSARTLVIAEGLLVYLTADAVSNLARDLHEQAYQWWLIDLASPKLLAMMAQRFGTAMQATPMIFGPAEGTAFFEPRGWREVEFRSTWEESLRLHRSVPFARLFDLLSRLGPKKKREENSRMSGIVLLERLAAGG